MINNFFTPQEIQPRKKSPYKLNLIDSYDFTLLQQDLFQIVSPHVESISDQKRKILSWLKKTPLMQRMDILTYSNKEFVCMIRAMYEKKQSEYYDESSTAFVISHIESTDEFDLLPMVNNKKLPKQYGIAEDDLLNNIRIMSRYTQFDSITFSQNFIRNVDSIFHYFEVLGDGISHELTNQDYQRLKKLPNSVMFYDPTQQHFYKKASLGTWITQVFMKHISMKYLQHELDNPVIVRNQLKQRNKEFQKYWKIITPERKNQIIKKVLQMKPIDLYQQHRAMIKVTRNGFPPIEKSDKVPFLLKSIVNANQKQIFEILFYTNLNETLESHSVLKFYITLQLQDEIKKYNELQNNLSKQTKMKKKNKKKKESMKPEQEKFHVQKTHQNNIYSQTAILHKDLTRDKCQANNFELKQKIQGEKVIVKGTDLFYKKLEVSQTQQIMCIEGNFNQNSENQSSLTPQLIEKESKTKKKKKNKNKNSQKNHSKQQKTDANNDRSASTQKVVLRKSSSKILDRNSQKSSETTNDHIDESKQDNHQLSTKKQQQQHCQSQDYLAVVLKDMEKKISFYNKQRKIVVNRLLYVFAQHQLSFKLYGSSLCDVALPSSDIDIVVDPSIVNYFYFSYSNYRKKIINSLEYLQKVFEKFQWASEFLLLPGANIPLLTFMVNPGIDFDFQQGNHQYNNRKELKEQIKIPVDITIQPYINMTDQVPIHLGVQSSQLIKEWISVFPFYSQLLLLLKLFTKNHNLNKMYHGGISSFMQAIILAGFYKHFFMNLNVPINDFDNKKEKLLELLPSESNLSNIFLEYCRFIMQFNEQKELIDINSEEKCCLKPQSLPKEQLGIVNPLTGQIMSERCTQFPLYKKLIHQLYDTLHSKNETDINLYLKVIFEA